MAETKGFEPSRPFRACTLSRGVPSTTRPRLRRPVYWACSAETRAFCPQLSRIDIGISGYSPSIGGDLRNLGCSLNLLIESLEKSYLCHWTSAGGLPRECKATAARCPPWRLIAGSPGQRTPTPSLPDCSGPGPPRPPFDSSATKARSASGLAVEALADKPRT